MTRIIIVPELKICFLNTVYNEAVRVFAGLFIWSGTIRILALIGLRGCKFLNKDGSEIDKL